MGNFFLLVTHCCSRVATYWPKSLSLHVYVYKKLIKIFRLNFYHESVNLKKMFVLISNNFDSSELITLFNVEPWTNTIYEIGFQWTFIGVVIHFTINPFSFKVGMIGTLWKSKSYPAPHAAEFLWHRLPPSSPMSSRRSQSVALILLLGKWCNKELLVMCLLQIWTRTTSALPVTNLN